MNSILLKWMMRLILLTAVVPVHSTTNEDIFKVVELCRKNPDHWPAIAYAVKLERADVVRFLIDVKEPVDAETPGSTIWIDSINTDSFYSLKEPEPGFTALELAIKAENLEIVEILLSHDSTNKADPERVRKRYANLSSWGGKTFANGKAGLNLTTYPLWHALSTNNFSMIDSILKAHKHPERFFNLLPLLKEKKEKAFIKSWLEHHLVLCQEKETEVSEEVIDLFMNRTLTDALKEEDQNAINCFLQHGWFVSEAEFILALQTLEHSEINQFLTTGRFTTGWNHDECLIKHGLEDLAMLHSSKKTLLASAKENRVDLFSILAGQANQEELNESFLTAIQSSALDVISFLLDTQGYVEGGLLHGVKHKQKAVIELLLKSAPISEKEKGEALLLAYQQGAYELVALLM